MMVERNPNLKEEVGGSIPDCEISSLLDIKLIRWSIASCALTLACRPSISKIYKIKNKIKFPWHLTIAFFLAPGLGKRLVCQKIQPKHVTT
jgi:hypothetical protein